MAGRTCLPRSPPTCVTTATSLRLILANKSLQTFFFFHHPALTASTRSAPTATLHQGTTISCSTAVTYAHSISSIRSLHPQARCNSRRSLSPRLALLPPSKPRTPRVSHPQLLVHVLTNLAHILMTLRQGPCRHHVHRHSSRDRGRVPGHLRLHGVLHQLRHGLQLPALCD